MNRAQRRKEEKRRRNKPHAEKIKCFKASPMPKPIPLTTLAKKPTVAVTEPDFSNVPLATICQSIQLLIDELRSRGYPMYDYDHKEKSIQLIQILQGKVFFMAAEEEKEHGEV